MRFFKNVGNVVELYSYKTIYYIENDKDSIEFKFKIIDYNNENLVLCSPSIDQPLYPLKCKNEKKELKCQIQKNKIEKFFNSRELSASLWSVENCCKVRLVKLTLIYDKKRRLMYM